DAKGEEVRDRPVYPWDLIASMYELLGIDRTEKLRHPHGHTVAVVPAVEDGVKSGGILQEII
ncbi:MAG: DUF1501 domain-containing protein, partial [Pirellulaceae bacterium]|nr:DUF1501 domain-containing protein [Pirellulaceae bacterium]